MAGIFLEKKPSCARRRDFLIGAGIGGAAAMLGLPAQSVCALIIDPSAPDDPSAHARDWAWLLGNWDVRHRRLKDRLAGSREWESFSGKSALWLTMGGFGTIDDNILDLPGGIYRAAGIRAFDPSARKWSIWWLDGRNPARIDPPVMGSFNGDSGTFLGEDMFQGRPILVRFRWRDIRSAQPHWEQAFSPDKGATWEVNWRNFFTRLSATPTPLPLAEGRRDDWDFLVGSWAVRHRRLKRRLVAETDWEEFDGTLINWPILGGQGNVGDNVMELPSGTYRGVGIRTFDPQSGQWLSWWLDGRNPTQIAPPVRGNFANGIGTFVGEEILDGQSIMTRVIWSGISANKARWEQAFSADRGQTWEINWVSDLRRRT